MRFLDSNTPQRQRALPVRHSPRAIRCFPAARRRPSRAFGLSQLALVLLGLALLAGCSDAPPLYEGMPEHVQQRHVALEGAANFRDLGGYATRDGRTVKWGKLYRSDSLAGLTDADLEKFSELGIALVCDFRGPDEWQEDPDRLPDSNPPEIAHLEIWDPAFSSKTFEEKLGNPDESADLGSLLVEINRLFASRFSDSYQAMFARITQPQNLPALVHCTAGKDRAGFASALILRVLDVPMETIYDDFLLTNHYTAEKTERLIFIIRAMSLFRTEADDLRGVLGVERRFLEAAFDEIDKRYGSFERYRREALGLSDEAVLAFQSLVLQ